MRACTLERERVEAPDGTTQARSPDDFADDDGVSETSTRNTGAAATKQLAAVRGWRLKEESARVSDLEGQLKDSKAELKQERAKLSALGRTRRAGTRRRGSSGGRAPRRADGTPPRPGRG